MSVPKTSPIDNTAETDLIARAIRRDEAAIRAIIALHNRRLFRLARGILRDDGEAEDALQNAYFKAFRALAEFRGEARLTTWLSRIVMNECLQRLRGARAQIPATIAYEPAIEAQIIPFPQSAMQVGDPEKSMAQRELLHLVETAVDALPDDFRLVLIARTIEGMSVEETAELLGVDREALVGFQTIRLFFDLEGDVSPDQRATLLKLTERYCVVYQTLRNSPPIAVGMSA